MLHLIYGNDRENIRAQYNAARETMRGKCDDERILSEGEISGDFLSEASSSRGLFGEKVLFLFDSILEKNEEQEMIVAHAEELGTSPNYFLVSEFGFNKKLIEDFEMPGVTTQECVSIKGATRPMFNIFSLGDALGKRNKKELWILYQGARESGLASEEINGTLFWALKNLALMKDAPVGALCGLNPFVAKKTREFATNYTKVEIIDMSRALVAAYHEAHRGGEPMDIALERFILGL